MTHDCHQLLGNLTTAVVHTDRVSLHDGRTVIDINNQTGQMVALAMYQAITVALRAIGQSDCLSHVQCRLQTAIPKAIINGNVLESQHANRDGTLLIVPHGNELTAGSHHPYHVAFLQPIVHVLDGTREHPRMKPAETFLLTSLELNLLVHDLLFLSVHNRPSASAAAIPRIALCSSKHRWRHRLSVCRSGHLPPSSTVAL